MSFFHFFEMYYASEPLRDVIVYRLSVNRSIVSVIVSKIPLSFKRIKKNYLTTHN